MLFKLPSPTPQRRVMFLIILLVVVVAMMWQAKNFFQGRQRAVIAPEEQVYQYSDNNSSPLSTLEPREEIHHDVIDNVIAVERARDPQALIALTPILLPAMELFTYRQKNNIAQPIIPRSIWNYEKILQEPSRWRWQILHIYGRVMRYYQVEYPQYPAGLQKLFFVLLLDEYEQNYFAVLTPAIPKNLAVANEDGTVTTRTPQHLAFDGIFVLNFPFYIAGTERRKEATPLFFAEKIYFANEIPARGGRFDEHNDPAGYADIAPKNPVTGLDIEFIRNKVFIPSPRDPDKKDGKISAIELEIAADLRAEKSAFDHIFAYLWAKNPSDLAREAKNPSMNYVNLLAQNQSAWMIGKPANFYGVVLSLEILRFAEDPFLESSGINRIYLITASDARYQNAGRYTWTLATPNLPAPLRRGDWINADGIFTKLYPYQTVNGNWQWSPLLLCKDLTKVTPTSPLKPAWLVGYETIFTIIVCVIILGLIFMWYYYNQKNNRELQRLVDRARGGKKHPCSK